MSKMDISREEKAGPIHYIYQPLTSADEIRILILEPGKDSTTLVGRLEVVNLSQAHGAFEAISYVWGSEAKDQTMIIDGKTLEITTSVRDALRQTRQLDNPRRLWIDGICINQKDDEEKGHQVQLMGRIYKTSRCTLICLGFRTDTCPRDLEALVGDVNEMMDRVFAEPGIFQNWNSFPFPKADDRLILDARWSCWNELLQQPWFHRGWVVQEAALSPECLVLWAGVEISWLDILRAYIWKDDRAYHLIKGSLPEDMSILHTKAYTLQRPGEARTFRLKRSADFSEMSTLSILDSARILDLKDPKDRIYAFMDLPTSDKAMPVLQPSYGEATSHLEVYRQFAVKYLTKTNDLTIVQYVENEEDEKVAGSGDFESSGGGQVRSPSFPSWIPRWDRGRPDPCMRDQNARKVHENSQEMTLLNNSILRVKGVIFDSVTYVSKTIPKPSQYEEIFAVAFSLWRDIAKQSIKYRGPHQSRLALAFLTAVSDAHDVGVLPEWVRLRQASEKVRQSYLDIPDFPPDAQLFSGFSLSLTFGRRFLVLGRGYCAISSVVTREGDVCAVIWGTSSPVILREVAGKSDHYTVVGPAHVQSAKTTVAGVPCYLGWNEECDDWRDWNLPTRDMFLC